MKGNCGVIAGPKLVKTIGWIDPPGVHKPGGNRHVWIKSYGSKSNGSGPTGYKAKPSRLLHRALADRVGVNLIVKARQAENRKRKLTPPRVIQGLLGAAA